MKKIKIILFIAVLAAAALSLCGCEKAVLQIDDNGEIIEVEATIPKTVEKVLKAAGIEIGENDIVTPSLDTKLEEVQEITVSREHTFKLTVNGETKDVTMVGGTVADLLEEEGISLRENQHVNCELDEYLTDGMDIQVYWQFEIVIICDHTVFTKTVEAKNVEGALEYLGITLDDEDRVSPSLTANLTDGTTITVSRVSKETVQETEEIDYETIYQNDSSMNKGKSKTVTAGVKGEKIVTYEIIYVDGKEESREVVSEEITKEPVSAVVKIGTKAVSSGKTIVSKVAHDDCDGSGHGYYTITYSDGSTATQYY